MTTNQVSKDAGWVTFGNQIREGVGFGYGFSVRVKMSDWDPDGRVGSLDGVEPLVRITGFLRRMIWWCLLLSK